MSRIAVVFIALVATVVVAIQPFNNKINLQASNFRAGAAKINATLPIGTPLAGYDHGQRRVPDWPLPEPRAYTTFMMPSNGTLDSIWAKALVLDDGETQIAFVTIDGIGSDENLNAIAWYIAAEQGFPIPLDNILFSSSHSHSGPGAISADFLWQMAPAVDLLVPELQRQMATSMATAMLEAYNSLQPALMATGMGYLVGVTQNRRAPNPWVQRGTIDPHLGVIRVDDAAGVPIATLWNFAVHGVCYGPSNMMFSGDIMGYANDVIEDLVGGISLFVNGDAGDIDPTGAACEGAPHFAGSSVMADTVQAVRESLTPTAAVTINAASIIVPFGPTDLNYTLQRFNNCTHGGFLDICGICELLRCDVNAHLYSSWIEQTPRFTAFTFTINANTTVIVSMPGEPLVELGWMVRNATLDMGFDTTFLAGYSNAHMGYFATPNEYDWGGYESQLTLWGIDTALKVRDGAVSVANTLQPMAMAAKSLYKTKAN